VAARLDQPVVANAWRVGIHGTTRSCAAGGLDVTVYTAMILLLAEEAAQPVSDVRHEAGCLDVMPVRAEKVIYDHGTKQVDPNSVHLAEAEFIVSAGNGVTDWDAFHKLAATLNAAEGGSRMVVDADLLPRQRQIGASGTVVSARGYLSLGISGAPQHLLGIQDCEHVIAVNSDPSCDMVRRADLAVIGDVQAIMPALIRIANQHNES
ncbi:MAG: electron transfer flavoprotein subunit alpha/FixB family protein, partial [Gammaproteobacteria bacterium]|nr:electron transfer flavoprotein subunit alpha/FixB family protein [Gammaproteobacteria bacterium]